MPLKSSTRRDATWTEVAAWAEVAEAEFAAVHEQLHRSVKHWREILDPFGEISDTDWSGFRPLRPGREEAWSDWLAHLLVSSATGHFAQSLITRIPGTPGGAPFLGLRAGREVVSRDRDRRADLLLEWGEFVLHIEVKVGDQHFEKTWETAEVLQRDYGRGRKWADAVLLPEPDLGTWDAVASASSRHGPVHVLTWRDVAVDLRRSLRARGEAPSWVAWAHSFCGVVEQRLLGVLPQTAIEDRRFSAMDRYASAMTLLHIMTEAADGR